MTETTLRISCRDKNISETRSIHKSVQMKLSFTVIIITLLLRIKHMPRIRVVELFQTSDEKFSVGGTSRYISKKASSLNEKF